MSATVMRAGIGMPPALCTDEARRAWLARALEQAREAKREQQPEGDAPAKEKPDPGDHEFDAEAIVARVQGREGWLREAKRQLDQDRWRQAGPIVAFTL